MAFTPHACVWVGRLWKGPPCGPGQVRALLLSMVLAGDACLHLIPWAGSGVLPRGDETRPTL